MKRNNFKNQWSSVIGKVRTFAKNRIAYINQLSAKGWWYFGETDDLPNIIIEGINNSGTATQAIKRKKQFIQAEGFKCEITANVPVDKKGNTFNGLLEDIVENTVKMEGFALNLFFNSEGKIASIKSVPIPWIRRKDDDHFVINRLMGEQNYRKTQDIVIREFDPREDYAVRAARIKAETKKNKGKQIGELFYCFQPKLGRNYDIYPVPSYYSAFDDIVSDGKISTLEMRNIVQGWRAPIIITTGQIDDINLDENDQSDLDKFNESIEEFLGEEASPVMHLMGRTPEETPQVTTIDMKEIVDMTEKATLRVGEKVARLLGVPPVLVGFAKAGQLGNVQEIKNMMTLFYLSIKEWQEWITRKLEVIQPCMVNGEQYDFEITRLNPFDFLPDKVIDRLSDAELREYFELPELEAEEEQQTAIEEDIVEPIEQAEAVLNQSYTDYPKAATENAKIALRWAEENGWGSCGTAVGKQRANQLAKGEPISEDTIARMAAFERHRQNSDKELGDGCGRLMWLAWGGDEGIAYAQRKLKEIRGE